MCLRMLRALIVVGLVACPARVGLFTVSRVFHEVGVPRPRCACVLESDDITFIGDDGGIL